MNQGGRLQNYYFHGFCLRSAIPLTTIPQWPTAQEDAALHLYYQPNYIPATLEDPVWSTPFVQIGRDRSVLVTVSAVGRFWLPDGEHIYFERTAEAQDYELETILAGSVAGLLFHQRRLLPLNASCVVLNGKAVALSGGSCIGKSALAAALLRRGALLLADDLCIAQKTSEEFGVAAATTHLRLWPDVLDKLEIASEQRLPTRLNHPCKAVPMNAAEAKLWPLSHLIRIVHDQSGAPSITAQRDISSLFPPKGLVFLREALIQMKNLEVEFRGISEIGKNLQRFQLKHPSQMEHYEACADLILETVQEPQ
jgi:hypothetical protein